MRILNFVNRVNGNNELNSFSDKFMWMSDDKVPIYPNSFILVPCKFKYFRCLKFSRDLVALILAFVRFNEVMCLRKRIGFKVSILALVKLRDRA